MNPTLSKHTDSLFPIRLRLVLGLVLVLAPAMAWAQSNLLIRVYPCSAGQAPALAEQLRGEFGVLPGVRLAADDRTSQIVVQAPAEVQVQIAQRLAAAGPAASSPGRSDPRRPAARAAQSRTIALRQLRAQQFELALTTMLGQRMSALPTNRPQARRYRLASAGGSVDLSIDLASAQVAVEGAAEAVDAAARLIQLLDTPRSSGKDLQLLPLREAELADVKRAAAVIRNAAGTPAADLPMVAMLFQQKVDTAPATPGAKPAAADAKPAAPVAQRLNDGEGGGLVSPVQIEMLDGLDVLVLKGNPKDVQQVMDIIKQVEQLSAQTEPAIEMLPIRQVDCEAMALLVRSLYDEVYLTRQGRVSITPVIRPNALLVVGRPENVKTVAELVGRLDLPAIPNSQFQVFHLRHASAIAAQATIQNFFVDRGGLGPMVRVTADARSNALIVQASPRDIAQVTELIRRIDVATSASVNEVRIIRLEHSLAQDVAAILQSAIGAATGTQGTQGTQGGQQGFSPFGPPPQQQQPNQNNTTGRQQTDQRAAMLRFLTIDAKGRKILQSGILSDVRVTADVRANALVISAPAENLELLEALVRQIDQLPAAEAQIKVFTIVNGDATNLAEMLRTLFGLPSAQGGQQQQPLFLQALVAGNDNTLVTLRFGVDTRTNSIIASGSSGDLNVVEAILTRLDDGEVRQRKSVVMRLKNAPAIDVATTINQFLTTQRQFEQATPGLTSAFEQIEREVVVVPEPVTNSLVLSATPRFFEEVRAIIEQLDARPPMVMIQVLIASVELGNTHEFGVELGLQDSVLFDRSTLSDLVTTSVTNQGVTSQQVISANQTPGFNFNNGNTLGNSGGANLNSNVVGGQGLANFAVGRQNSQLGYGGLVLSAQSENVSILLRALAENRRVEILERPQVMTLDNQPAFIQVGKRVPRITGVSNNNITGQTNSITLDNVGLILGVTPRISPDGLVVMQIDAEKSEVESDATGIPVYTSATGQVIRSPIIDATTAQTTVSALSGQTIVLGGLISKKKSDTHRKVPLLGDVPLVGRLFRYDGTSEVRTELLIIMTPHIVKNACDADRIKQAEAARMSWCLCDVTEIYGEAGLRTRRDHWSDAEVPVIYPDQQVDPSALPGNAKAPEVIRTPPAMPVAPLPGPPRSIVPPAAPGPKLPVAPLPPQVPADPPPLQPVPAEPSVGMHRPGPYPVQYPEYVRPTPAYPSDVQPAGYHQPAAYQPPAGYSPPRPVRYPDEPPVYYGAR